MDERVVVIVGGTRFETLASTLLVSPVLTSLAASSSTFFVDRDPQLFPYVLGYLRDRDRAVFPTSHLEMTKLLREAEFYQIESLVESCRSRMNSSPPILCVGDLVHWRACAIEPYSRMFVRALLDDSLILPFVYSRNNHLLARCFACDACQDPKCSGLFEIDLEMYAIALAHHMQSMRGTVQQVIGEICVVVKWDNGKVLHLPRTAIGKQHN